MSDPHDSPNSEAVPTSSAQTYVLLKESQDSGRTSRIWPEKDHASLCLTTQNKNTVPNSTERGTVTQEVESWDSMAHKAINKYYSLIKGLIVPTTRRTQKPRSAAKLSNG